MKGFLLASISLLAGLGMAGASHAADSDFDIAVQATIANDNYSYGLTNTNHQPWGQISITPSYGIFYGTVSFENLKYTNVAAIEANNLNSRLKLTAGIAPSLNDNVSFDINVQRDMRLNSITGGRYRTVPYVTGTFKFNDMFSVLAGGGYYAYDNTIYSPNTVELYAGVKFNPADVLSLSGDLYWDQAGAYSAGFGTPTQSYVEAIATAKIKVVSGLTISGQLALENYEAVAGGLPSYMWYDIGADYALNDHISVGAHYIGNNLVTGSAGCGLQSWNADCDARFMASLTVNGKLSDLNKRR